jgi:hypothetical protein
MKMYATRASRAANWGLNIKGCVYAYNTAVHTAHGFTPFYLTHGYHPSSLYTSTGRLQSQPSRAPERKSRTSDRDIAST